MILKSLRNRFSGNSKITILCIFSLVAGINLFAVDSNHPIKTIETLNNVNSVISLNNRNCVATDKEIKCYNPVTNECIKEIQYPAEVLYTIEAPGFTKYVRLAKVKDIHNRTSNDEILFALGYQDNNDPDMLNANLWLCNTSTGMWVKVNQDTVTDIVKNGLSHDRSKYYNQNGKLFFNYEGKGVVVDYSQFLDQV